MVLFPVKAFLNSIGKDSTTDNKWELCHTDLESIPAPELRQIHKWLAENVRMQ